MRVSNRVQEVLNSWLGTKYMDLQCRKGGGVDCVRFVCAVADELYGFEREPLDKMPADRSLHDRKGAMAGMRKIVERYKPISDVTMCEWVEPGDIFVVGPRNGGPGHAMIVGGIPGHVWHTIREVGVQVTGMPALDRNTDLFRIYRGKDKHLWLSEARI